MSTDTTAQIFHLVASLPKLSYDYTPNWVKDRQYINSVTFAKVLADKAYTYRVMAGDKDLGVKPSYAVGSDGSQKINFLEYNGGYGIDGNANTVYVYVVDPETGNQYKIAQSK
ncbi:hypothetical protein BOTBODRAFT_164106 [Botryobasidium botryosum FD-172 SS1]|uniref:Immunomodulatory protein FIP-Fve n=1 Tax=Botryobasidium botryosum (strain FD-172 SS1) TaxID=930990 RepID=A0A067MEZ4_BOTB1|nr:hypothetical protein BOTBODRAFT_164106 [Botryobasidium botryosum FD-172 SS1]